jgi:hypothetical protein
MKRIFLATIVIFAMLSLTPVAMAGWSAPSFGAIPSGWDADIGKAVFRITVTGEAELEPYTPDAATIKRIQSLGINMLHYYSIKTVPDSVSPPANVFDFTVTDKDGLKIWDKADVLITDAVLHGPSTPIFAPVNDYFVITTPDIGVGEIVTFEITFE